jgi:AcrR family transcriptional regulator
MSTSPKHPVSRRDRPAKPPLSREVIVSSAVSLLRSEGLERLTMRRLAASLDTGAASLYVYFRSTGHLYAALLDELLGEVDLSQSEPGEPWQDRLASVIASYVQVLFEFPSVARLSVFTRPTGPNSLRMFETLLTLLNEGGVEPGAAAWGADLLVLYATSTAAEHSTREENPGTPDDESDMALALSEVSADVYPRLHELRDTLLAGAPTERFRWGIDVILSGLTDQRSGDAPNAYVPSAMRVSS